MRSGGLLLSGLGFVQRDELEVSGVLFLEPLCIAADGCMQMKLVCLLKGVFCDFPDGEWDHQRF